MIYDKVRVLPNEGGVVKGFRVGARERWREIDGRWVKAWEVRVVERMCWVKTDGVFHGTFGWVQDDRFREWEERWYQGKPKLSRHASAIKSGVFHAMPQEILLDMLHEIHFVSPCPLFALR